MNQFTSNRTRAIAAWTIVNTLEKSRGEGVTVREVASMLQVHNQTARKWLAMAENDGLVVHVERQMMGAATQFFYYGLFSKSFDAIVNGNYERVLLTDNQRELLGMNG